MCNVGVVDVWLAVDAKPSAHKIMIVVLAVGVVNLGIVADTSARTVVVLDDVLMHTFAAQVVLRRARLASCAHHADENCLVR